MTMANIAAQNVEYFSAQLRQQNKVKRRASWKSGKPQRIIAAMIAQTRKDLAYWRAWVRSYG